MKKWSTVLCMLMAAAMLLTACGSSGGSSSGAASGSSKSSGADSGSDKSSAASDTGNGAASNSAASGDSKAAGEKGTFTVGFDQDFPPFGFKGDDGNFTGFDIELATEAAKRLGKTVKLMPIDWDSKDLELSSGSIDCIWNGFTVNGREDSYTWSKSYMKNTQVMVVRNDSGINDFAGLAGKVVTVQTDSSAQAALDEEKNAALKSSFADVVECAEYNSAFMDLESGAVDAIAMDVGVARYQIKSRNANFKVLDGSIAEEEYGVGFNKGNTELRDQVDKVLEEMVADGTFATISKKWFDADVCIIGK